MVKRLGKMEGNSLMKKGYLSQYFDGIGLKLLSEGEIEKEISNQHEFNGVGALRKILGSERKQFKTKFLYLSDKEDQPVQEDSFLTWYDAREKARNERGVMRREYRLYYQSTVVVGKARENDLLVIAKRPDGTLLAIIAEYDSTVFRQILWLMGSVSSPTSDFAVRVDLNSEKDQIEFTSRRILEAIGMVVDCGDDRFLEDMIKRFGCVFPKTITFSEYARHTLPDIDPWADPDSAFMEWMEREEALFRSLERHIIRKRLERGFGDNIDEFISFSLSVQNRRKSRAGLALENHLEFLFKKLQIRFSRNPITENKTRPDFVFPGEKEYHDSAFDPMGLTMLGVKTSCKDRWRQILAEADRIERKHLMTLEPAISKQQTTEMESKNVQLVLPRKLHQTYFEDQTPNIFDLSAFTRYVREKQMGL